MLYNVMIAYKSGLDDKFINITYDYTKTPITNTQSTETITDGNSTRFKIMPNSDTVLTDKYLYIDGEMMTLPQNGELTE